MKSYLDYGLFGAMQRRRVTALDECDDEVVQIRERYHRRRDALVAALRRGRLADPVAPRQMFAWAPIPEPFRHLGSLEFARRLIDEAGVAVAPGVGFGSAGEGFVRIALVEDEPRSRLAAERVHGFLQKGREGVAMAAPHSSAWFRCAEGCDFRAELTEVVYECPRCGGLLEVEHDRAALARRARRSGRRSSTAASSSAPGRTARASGARRSGSTRSSRVENVVSMFEGGSPLLRVDRYAREIGLDDVWVKECGVTHTGSFKDLGMTVLVSAVKEMRARGREVRAVACASTGDTSAALSAYCAAAGIPSVVLLPRGQDLDRPARPAHLERRAGPRARHRLRRLHARRAGISRGRRTSTSRTR